MEQTNVDVSYYLGELLGYEGGYPYIEVTPTNFVPGSMADNLTSFSGYLFEYSGQDSILAFLTNGATASYGTVFEPCNYPQKFPDSQLFFYQARGFSAGECYYMSVTNYA